MLFPFFICENYKVKASNLSHHYLLQFKQLHNRVTGGHMDTNDAKEVYKYTIRVFSFTLWIALTPFA